MGFISELFGYILNWLYGLVNNYGVAIIIFSILLRVILIPITIKQQKSMKKSAVLQEKMAEIQKKYKNNPEKLNQETIELYQREKMSPFSGCLTSILQLVIILAVFWLVSQPLTYMKRIDPQIIEKYTNEMKESNFSSNNSYVQISVLDYAETKYQEIEEQLKQENVENREALEAKRNDYNQLRLNMEFLGIDLSKVPTQNKKKKKKEEIVMENGEVKEEPDPMEQMQAMNKSMTYMMPIMSVMIAVIAPLGLALYWLMSNILMIIERLVINKIMESKEDKDEGEKANG